MFWGRRYRRNNRYEPKPTENNATVVTADVIISDNCTKSGKCIKQMKKLYTSITSIFI